MAKNVIRRMNKYNRKMLPDRVAQQFELAKPEMLQESANALGQMAKMEDMTRAILGDMGIQTINYPWYLNFARQVWKVKQGFTGRTVELEAQNIRAVWVARGLDGSVLDRLLTDVFNVALPEAA